MATGWNKILIQDDEVTAYYGDRPYRRGQVSDLGFSGTAKVRSGLFPPGLRWIDQAGHLTIVERPPSYKTIAYEGVYREAAKNHKNWRIAVPWQVYIVRHHGDSIPTLYTYVRKSPLETPDDKLLLYPLPNVGSDGQVCMHVEHQWPNFVKGSPTLAERTMFMINALWMSGFNHNMGNILAEQGRQPPELRKKLKNMPKDTDVLNVLEEVRLDEIVTWTWPESGSTPAVFAGGGGRGGKGLVDNLAARLGGIA